MNRRDLLILLAGAGLRRDARAAGAQQPAMPVIGYLGSGASGRRLHRLWRRSATA